MTTLTSISMLIVITCVCPWPARRPSRRAGPPAPRPDHASLEASSRRRPGERECWMLPSPEDHVAISDLLARYCLTLDQDDVEGWVSLFTPDASYEVYG